MIEIILGIIVWCIAGAVPGFYGAYMKRHDPRYGVIGGAAVGFVVGFLGFQVLEIIDTPAAGLITVIGLVAVIGLLVPFGNYNEQVSRNARIANLAYALTLPSVLIVVGIVVFPVIWNLIFSFRDIETGDLANVDLFDVSDASFNNYSEKLSLTFETTPCQVNFEAVMILYAGGFDADNPTEGFVVMDTGLRTASGAPQIARESVRDAAALEADTQYVVVMTGNAPAVTVSFNITFDGPGDVFLGEIDGDAEQTSAYSAATSDEQTFQRTSRTGREGDDGQYPYHSQPFYVTEGGDYVITSESASEDCLVNENGDTVYASLTSIGVDDYDELVTFNLSGEHYVVGARDPEFYRIIARTLFYTLASTILSISLGLIAALLVRDAFRGRAIFRGFLLFPYIAPVISVAFVWNVMLRQNGPINEVIGGDTAYLNPSAGAFLGISVPLLMNIMFQTWRYFPFAFLFLLARIQAIPDDMYEAAKVDGAAPSQRLIYITLPQLRAVFGTLFLLRFIWTFNKFDDIFLLTGDLSETRVITVEIFRSLFTLNNIGQASSIAVVMAMMLAIVMLIYFRFFLVEEE